MSAWQSGGVEANGIRLHYTRTGGDKPPVVLAHGFTDDGLCWTPIAEALAPDYDVVMVDARGHGRSEAPEHGYDPAEQAKDLVGVITALELARPAVLGHSMGAMSALVLAGILPDLPGAILLEDPPAWWARLPAARPADPEGPARRRASLSAFARQSRGELIAGERAVHPGWSEADLGPWADAKLRVSPNVAALFEFDPATAVDWPAALRRIACPMLLIAGDPALGAIVTEDDAETLRALVPRVRVAHVPDAGHSIRRDQFGRYTDAVRAFLAEWSPPPDE